MHLIGECAATEAWTRDMRAKGEDSLGKWIKCEYVNSEFISTVMKIDEEIKKIEVHETD